MSPPPILVASFLTAVHPVPCPLRYSSVVQYSYAGALHACMHLRDHTLSMTLLDEMEAAGKPANAEGYATVIRTCARCGRKEEAVFVYLESLRLCIAPSKVGTALKSSDRSSIPA